MEGDLGWERRTPAKKWNDHEGKVVKHDILYWMARHGALDERAYERAPEGVFARRSD